MCLNPNCVSTGNGRSQSTLFSFFSRRLLGRLYLLAAILALDFVSMAGALHVKLDFSSSILPVAVVSFAVFLSLGHTWLKTQREDIPFGFIFLGGYLACLAAGICIHLLMAFS
jgi:hypothetical protein